MMTSGSISPRSFSAGRFPPLAASSSTARQIHYRLKTEPWPGPLQRVVGRVDDGDRRLDTRLLPVQASVGIANVALWLRQHRHRRGGWPYGWTVGHSSLHQSNYFAHLQSPP